MPYDLQAAEDAAAAAGAAVDIPAGDVWVPKPVRLRAATFGDRGGRTNLRSQFGSGPLLYALPPLADGTDRPFGLDLGDPLVPGVGRSVHLTPHRVPDLSSEPGCDVSGLSAFTARCFYRRDGAAGTAGVLFHSSVNLGVESRNDWGVWEYPPGNGWIVYWAGKQYTTPAAPVTPGTVYYVALTYDGTQVRLWVGTPGQPVAAPLWSLACTGKVPQLPRGLSRVGIGYNPYAPDTADTAAFWGFDAWVYGFEVKSDCEHAGPFAAPAALPDATPQTRVQVTGESDGPFLVSRRGDGLKAYCLTPGSGPQGAGVVLTDVTLYPNQGGSGLVCFDTIQNRIERVKWVGPVVGLELRGATYQSTVRDVGGLASGYSVLVVGQSMGLVGLNWTLRGYGVPCYFAGSVGGGVWGLNLTPDAGSYCSLYQGFAGPVLYGVSVDDEGQGGQTRAALVSDQGTLRVSGQQVLRASPGPLVAVARGGTAVLSGCDLFNAAASPQQVECVGAAPARAVRLSGCDCRPAGVPASLTAGAVVSDAPATTQAAPK